MKQRVKVKTKEPKQEKKATESCSHYWIIEVANGPTSLGECKYCGEKKEFHNAFQDFNPLRRPPNPMKLPEIPSVKVNKESSS